jgi:hypothetical protein
MRKHLEITRHMTKGNVAKTTAVTKWRQRVWRSGAVANAAAATARHEQTKRMKNIEQ